MIIISILLGGGIGFLYNKPHIDYQQSNSVFVGHGNEFLEKARADEAGFSAEFLNKAVELEGIVTEAGSLNFTLDQGLICTLDPTIDQAIPNIGDLVKVKGRMVGKEEDILTMETICNLDQCVIITD